MAARGIRRRDDENLTDTQLEKVVSLLSADKPITKKEACELLNITYNTTRLQKIIDDYISRRDYRIKKRKELKNKPLEKSDVKYILEEYLKEPNISQIAETLFRGPNVVKKVLNKYNVPLRDSTITYTNPLNLEPENMAEDYAKDDLVYSARYASPAIIVKKLEVDNLHGTLYRIWVYSDMQFAIQPWYELADLRVLQKEFSIKIEDFPKEEAIHLINQALTKAKKAKKDE